MNRSVFFMAFLSFLYFSTISRAQTLSGIITDAETHQPLEAVMISVLRGNMMIDYTPKGNILCPGSIAGHCSLMFPC